MCEAGDTPEDVASWSWGGGGGAGTPDDFHLYTLDAGCMRRDRAAQNDRIFSPFVWIEFHHFGNLIDFKFAEEVGMIRQLDTRKNVFRLHVRQCRPRQTSKTLRIDRQRV